MERNFLKKPHARLRSHSYITKLIIVMCEIKVMTEEDSFFKLTNAFSESTNLKFVTF